MQIILHEFDRSAPQPVQVGAGIGYWCDFESSLASGKGLFVPDRPALEIELGKPVEVKVEMESVSGVQPLQGGELERFELLPLQPPGDYLAIGRIVSLVWLDDEREDAMLEVLVGEDLFSFPAGSAGEAALEFGGWVSFRIQRLILRE